VTPVDETGLGDGVTSEQVELAALGTQNQVAVSYIIAYSVGGAALIVIMVILGLCCYRCPQRLPGSCARLMLKKEPLGTANGGAHGGEDDRPDQESGPREQTEDHVSATVISEAITPSVSVISALEEVGIDLSDGASQLFDRPVATPQVALEVFERPPETPTVEARPSVPHGSRERIHVAASLATPLSHFPPSTPAEHDEWMQSARYLVEQAGGSLQMVEAISGHSSSLDVDLDVTRGETLWLFERAEAPAGWKVAVRKAADDLEADRGLVPEACVRPIDERLLPSIADSPSGMQSAFATPDGATTPAPTEASIFTPMGVMLDPESNEPREVVDAARVLVDAPVAPIPRDASSPTPREGAEDAASPNNMVLPESPSGSRSRKEMLAMIQDAAQASQPTADSGTAQALEPAAERNPARPVGVPTPAESQARGQVRDCTPTPSSTPLANTPFDHVTMGSELPPEDLAVRGYADEPETAEVIVPTGCGPGHIFRAIIADGRELTIRCPDDGGPGDVLEIDLPPADHYNAEPDSPSADMGEDVETAEVIVPTGLLPGQSFTTTASWGGVFEVVVPPGTLPGSTLFVELPASATPAQEEGPTAARLNLRV